MLVLRASLFGLLLCPHFALAATAVFDLDPFTGDPLNVRVTAQDLSGSVAIDVEVINAPPVGDLLGVYFDLSDLDFDLDAAWLNSITGTDVTARALNTNDVAPEANVNPMGLFDVGIGIGTPGIGTDDISAATINVPNITVANLVSFAVRANSVTVGDSRSGSSKLFGIPEPTTMTMFGIAIVFFLMRGIFEPLRRLSRIVIT